MSTQVGTGGFLNRPNVEIMVNVQMQCLGKMLGVSNLVSLDTPGSPVDSHL